MEGPNIIYRVAVAPSRHDREGSFHLVSARSARTGGTRVPS
jgi:hypothetical protein